MNANEELVAYLKEGNFQLFMQAWKLQIERLGHVGGSISLALSDENRDDISGFLGKDYRQPNKVKIAWSVVERAIMNSRFEDVDFAVVVREYFGSEIISKRSEKNRKQQLVEHVIGMIYNTFQNSNASNWLTYVITENNSAYSKLKQAILHDDIALKKQLTWVMSAINELPLWRRERENLAIFASRITQDPHAFDQGTLCYYFLLHAACYFLHSEYRKMNYIEKNDMLYQVGLYRDSVSNFCMLAHINAFESLEHHHPAWNGFYEHYEAWNVNIQNLKAIIAIDEISCKTIFVTENPSVFQVLVEFAKEHNIQDAGFLCTNGQLNFCGYLLMDMIYQSGILMMYSGDMDPEGLLIADKLKQRYQEGIQLWRYTRQDYEIALSKKHADKKRLAMTSLIQHADLQQIGRYLQEEAIGYQENLIEEYKSDLSAVPKQAV